MRLRRFLCHIPIAVSTREKRRLNLHLVKNILMILQNRDIIIVGLQPWYIDIGSTCKNIAMQFAKHNRVLYINTPLNRSSLHKKNDAVLQKHLEIRKSKRDDLIEVQPNLWNYYPHCILESINWIPSSKIFSIFNKINNRRFAKEIKSAAARVGFKDYILFNDNDIFRSFYLKELLKPHLYVYLYRDYILGFDYWKKHGVRLQPQNIAKADLAIGNSTHFKKIIEKYNTNTYFIGTGVDVSLYNPENIFVIADDAKSISHPRIGYVGSLISSRLDLEIISKIAGYNSDWQIVLVGPEDEDFKNSDLHKFSNVHFLGKKTVESLPGYIQSFDVCINPQLLNEITIGNYPLKIDEYLAMGKPVVATKTEAMDIFEQQVYLANDADEYVSLIQKALQENTPELEQKRIAFAHTHTWENSVLQIYDAIEKTPTLTT